MSLSIEYIDDVLFFFYKIPQFYNSEQLSEYVLKKFKGKVIIINGFTAILNKLVKDGYLIPREIEGKTFYCISFEGIDFYEKGGYNGLASREKTEREIQERNERLQQILTQKELEKINLEIADLVDKLSDYSTTKSNAKWAFIFSIITVIIALAALVVQILKK